MIPKYAAVTVLSAEMGEDRVTLHTAHRHAFVYDRRPGFLYIRSRAISSRCNDNWDEFPAAEIKQAYKTFIGKPVFVNHHNANHRRARGVVIDAALHEDTTPDGKSDTWVEALMEIDAVKFPRLAQAILAGEVDRTSMGTDVEYSICSYCGNRASTPLEYCAHIPKLKGKRIRRTTASGTQEDVLVREICYGLKFFENSLLVEDPADPTAVFLGDVEAGPGIQMAAARKTALPAEKDAQPWRIISIKDTREFVEDANDRFVPLPGTGDMRPCDRCQRTHEIHAHVRTTDGSEYVVGVGCARVGHPELDVPLKAGTSAATTLAKNRAEVKRWGEKAHRYDQIAAQVQAMPFPGFDEQPARFGEPDSVELVTKDGKAFVVIAPWANRREREEALHRIWYGKQLQDRLEAEGISGWSHERLREAKRRLERHEQKMRQMGLAVEAAQRRLRMFTSDKLGLTFCPRCFRAQGSVDDPRFRPVYSDDPMIGSGSIEVCAECGKTIVNSLPREDRWGVKTGLQSVRKVAADDQWSEEDERKHPRGGHPQNPGQFSKKPGGPKKEEPAKRAPEGGDPSAAQPKPSDVPEEDRREGEEAVTETVEEAEDKPTEPSAQKGTSGTGTKEDPIVTDDIEVAARALIEDKHVQLNQPRQVSTLLDRLGQMVADASQRNERININLCNVTVPGTNLFCTEAFVASRKQMPQMKGKPLPGSKADKLPKNSKGEADIQILFRQSLINQGVKIVKETVPAGYLKATQQELAGDKVAGIMGAIRAETLPPQAPLFVSSNDYVVDGHHRWAALVGLDFMDNKLGDMPLEIERIDMRIEDLLKAANAFAIEWGVPPQGVQDNPELMRQMQQAASLWKSGHRKEALRMVDDIAALAAHLHKTKTFSPPDPAAEAAWIRQLPKKAQPLVTTTEGIIDGRPAHILSVDWGDPSFDPSLYKRDPHWDALVPPEMWNVGELVRADEVRPGDMVKLVPGGERLFEVGRLEEYGFWPKGLEDKPGQLIGFMTGGGWQGPYRPKMVWRQTPQPGRQRAAKLGIGETKAPAEIDTLREEACPVCGESDSFDGDKCQVCGYIRPPEQYLDPDLEKAKEIDLRQDKEEAETPSGQLRCDNCGATFEGEAAEAKAPPFIPPKTSAEVERKQAPRLPKPEDDAADDVAEEEMVEEHHKAGDTCPTCGKGTLQPVGEETSADEGVEATPAQAPASDEEQEEPGDGDDGDEDEDEEQDEDGDKPPWLKKKPKGTQKEESMRPALAALAEQQKIITRLSKQVDALTEGISFIAHMAGLEGHPKVAVLIPKENEPKEAVTKQADENNPGQPVPDPGSEGPVQTTEEARAPDATDDPTNQGASPLTDVAPDATTSLDATETVLDEQLDLNEEDVTKPVTGTEGPRPLDEVKIETEQRIDQPDQRPAFPLEGPFTEEHRTTGGRTIQALRLARLRMQAGIEEAADDLVLGTEIDSGDMTDESIAAEIETLSKVVRHAAKAKPKPRNLVPRSAGREERMPSLQGEPQFQAVASAPSADEFLFE